MNAEVFKEVIQELHSEIKLLKEGQDKLVKILERNINRTDNFEAYLESKEFRIPINEFNDFMVRNNQKVFQFIEKNIPEHKKIAEETLHRVTNWKTIIHKTVNRFIWISGIIILMLIIMVQLTPVLKENLKYKRAYEYAYYINKDWQDLLQETLIYVNHPKAKKEALKKLNNAKKNSLNPLTDSN
jgi:hypothetical protein